MPPSFRSFPSPGSLASQAGSTLRRFPFVMACAAVSSFAAIRAIDAVVNPEPHWRLLAAATLGLPLLTALAVTAERRPGFPAQLGAALFGVAILAAFYAAWPRWTDPQRAFHYVQLSLAFHLSAAVLPFAGRPLHRAFWQYNRRLLERFLVAAVFAAVIFFGLALALASLDKLLGFDIEPQAYGRVWAMAAFVIATWIFLAGVPADVAALEGDAEYPRLLEILAQRILVPLVSLYIIILMVYLVRVVVTREWPSGWIGWLVSALGVTGTLVLLLVQPMAGGRAQGWIARFARVYWLAVIPAVVMLWLAVRQRVVQYGITEARYAVIVLSVWLFAMAVFSSLRRSADLRVIPASLALLALGTVAGPWSAYPVSFRSQYGRLQAMLTANGMLANGKLRPPARPVPNIDRREIAAAVSYLIDRQGRPAVSAWFAAAGVRVDHAMAAAGPGDPGARVARAIGVPAPGFSLAQGDFHAVDTGALDVAGYDVLIRRILPRATAGDTGYLAVFDTAARAVRVQHGEQVLLTLPLDPALDAAASDTTRRASDPIVVRGRDGGWDAVLRITGLVGTDSTGRFRDVSGPILLRKIR